MLRELNENEMEMVSGGTDPQPDPDPGPWIDAPTIHGPGLGSQDQSVQDDSSVFLYNGYEYASAGAADVARIRDGNLESQFGSGSDPATDPTDSPTIPSVSGISPTNTGTAVGTAGPLTVGIDPNAGNPRVTGSSNF